MSERNSHSKKPRWEKLNRLLGIYTQQKKLRKMCSMAYYEKSGKVLEIKTS